MAQSSAVCLAGELRSLIFPIVQRRLVDTLLAPLDADAFLVGSRAWAHAATLDGKPPEWGLVDRPPSAVSSDDVKRIHDALQPHLKATAMLDEGELHRTSIHLMGLDAWLLNSARNVGDAIMDPRKRCDDNDEQAPAWHRERCRIRVLHAIRLHVCLSLIEDSESRRRMPYASIVRTRPDVWLPCVLSPHSLLLPSGMHVAFSWDHLTIMARHAASTALRELALSPAVPACSLPGTMEQCGPCLMRKHGFSILALKYKVDVARHCQLLSEEKERKVCRGFAGPTRAPPLNMSAVCPRAREGSYLYGALQFPDKRLGCDDDGGGGGGGGIPRRRDARVRNASVV